MQPEKITTYFKPNPKPITHLPQYESKNNKYYGDNNDPEFINKLQYYTVKELEFYWENLCRLVNNMDNSRPGSDSYRTKMEERRDMVYRLFTHKSMEQEKRNQEEEKRQVELDKEMDAKYGKPLPLESPPLKKRKTRGGEETHDRFLLDINMRSEMKPKKVIGKPGLRPMPEKIDLKCEENLSTDEESDSDKKFEVCEESQINDY